MAPQALAPNNHTVPESSQTAVTVQQVSWQSAFLGLLAIALNTCLQEPSTVLGFDIDLAVLLRSTPIVCFLDSILVWLQLGYWSWKYGIWKATKIVAGGRMLEKANGNITVQRSFKTLLLVLLAALQAVKLFGYRGILWTQACAAAFLMSYVTNLWLEYFDQPVPIQSSQDIAPFHGLDSWPSSEIIHIIVAVAVLLQTSAWIHTLDEISHALGTRSEGSIAFWLAFAVGCLPMLVLFGIIVSTTSLVLLLVLGAFVVGLMYVCNKIMTGLGYRIEVFDISNKELMGFAFCMLLTYGGLFLTICFELAPTHQCLDAAVEFGLSIFGLGDFRLSRWVFAACLLVGLCLWYEAIFYVFIKIYVRMMHNRRGAKQFQNLRLYWFVLSANFRLAFMYYRYVYVQDGTSKPSWTEHLG